MIKSINNFKYVLKTLKQEYQKSDSPSVTLIANTTKNPYNVLISTLISLRTKDEVTLAASQKLFSKANNIHDLLKLSEEEIASLIYPCGFYKTKAGRILEIAHIIINEYNGNIPNELDQLLSLPGVGRKTANLVLSLGFNKPGLCVDTHVHRITNRFGWVKTRTPEKTEMALRKLLPQKFWRDINDFLVSYGQTICKPISPFCSRCPLSAECPKTGVTKSR